MHRRTIRSTAIIVATVALALVATSCGDDDDTADSDTTTTAADAKAASCNTDDLALKTDGKLTVATGEPAFPPWIEDDDPTNKKGFEGALVYAIADQLGIDEADVTWTRTGFDEAVAPGEKDYDFNVQQYSISGERDQVVDFSDPYYDIDPALIGRADGPLAGATSLADLKEARLGAAIGSTSLDYIEQVIQPTNQPLVFDDNAAAKAAFDANQVDGIVFDLPTAWYITSAEITDSTIIGVLPAADSPEQLGALFETGSVLIPCVNEALATLKDDGTLAALETEWLTLGGDIPTLTK